MNLFIEAVVVGIATVIMGTLVSQGLQLMSPPIKSACKGWNRYYIMELALFLTGFFLHIAFEYSGGNRWYCKHGSACQK
jgi:hypothetical protein